MKISAIIPTHNGSASIIDTLESICDQTLPSEEYEIIIMDNASNDNTNEIVQRFIENNNRRNNIYLYREQLLGLHFARNSAALKANSEILAYTDDDVLVSSTWLENMLRSFDCPQIASVGSKVKAKWLSEPPEWILHYAQGYLSLLDLGDKKIELDWPGIWGCNMAIRRSVLVEQGGFHPEAFGDIWIGDGETGLLNDVMAAGYKLVYTPDAMVWHVIPPDRLTLNYMRRRFANQAACDEFAEYRKDYLQLEKFLFHLLSKINKFIMNKLKALKYINKKNAEYYNHELMASYFFASIKYRILLLFSSKFRKIVLHNDWINKFDHIINQIPKYYFKT